PAAQTPPVAKTPPAATTPPVAKTPPAAKTPSATQTKMPVSATCPNENHNCTGLTPCCGPSGFCGSQSTDCGVGCYPQFSESGACML
ncbi:23126_t:CDS:1, partial [Gigaspora margarita]